MEYKYSIETASFDWYPVYKTENGFSECTDKLLINNIWTCPIGLRLDEEIEQTRIRSFRDLTCSLLSIHMPQSYSPYVGQIFLSPVFLVAIAVLISGSFGSSSLILVPTSKLCLSKERKDKECWQIDSKTLIRTAKQKRRNFEPKDITNCDTSLIHSSHHLWTFRGPQIVNLIVYFYGEPNNQRVTKPSFFTQWQQGDLEKFSKAVRLIEITRDTKCKIPFP